MQFKTKVFFIETAYAEGTHQGMCKTIHWCAKKMAPVQKKWHPLQKKWHPLQKKWHLLQKKCHPSKKVTHIK